MSMKGIIIHSLLSVSGVNSYVRVSGYPLTCSLNLAFEDESTGPDIFSRSLQAHANVTSIEADELFARQSGNDKPPAILPFRDEVSQLSSPCTQRYDWPSENYSNLIALYHLRFFSFPENPVCSTCLLVLSRKHGEPAGHATE